MIMGFAGRQVLNDLGHIAFLDLGSNDGITVGDEFVLYGATSASDARGRRRREPTFQHDLLAGIQDLASPDGLEVLTAHAGLHEKFHAEWGYSRVPGFLSTPC